MHAIWHSGLLRTMPNSLPNNTWAMDGLGTAYVIPSLPLPFALLLVTKHAEGILLLGRLVCMGI